MKKKIEELEKVTKWSHYGLDVDFSIITESGEIKKYRCIDIYDEDKARKKLRKYIELYDKALEENRVVSFERIFMFGI